MIQQSSVSSQQNRLGRLDVQVEPSTALVIITEYRKNKEDYGAAVSHSAILQIHVIETVFLPINTSLPKIWRLTPVVFRN